MLGKSELAHAQHGAAEGRSDTVAPTVMPVPTPMQTVRTSMFFVKVPLVSFSTICQEFTGSGLIIFRITEQKCEGPLAQPPDWYRRTVRDEHIHICT